MEIRPYQPSDVAELKRITIEGFDGIAIDQHVESLIGIVNGRDWRWRKAKHIDEDIEANPKGVFVATEVNKVVGYITTRVDYESGRGRIPNLAVDLAARGRGIGRDLIEFALEYMRREGMSWAVIETMENNPIGQRLYPACGFIETCRQIHYARKL